MNRFFKNFFGFSPAESRGFIVLVLLILIAVAFPFFIDKFNSNEVEEVKISMNKIEVNKENGYKNYDNKYSNYNKNSSNDYNKKYQLKPFDPNLSNASEFESLGIPKFIAERIVKYREKGGKFKKKEDFAKIYGLKPEKYEELEPFINLPSLESQKSQTPQAEITNLDIETSKNPVSEIPKIVENTKPTFKKPVKFDINLVDTTTLKQLPGIGSGYAKRIIKFRESLGGFIEVAQISETFNLPPEVFQEIEKFGYFQTQVKKINVNLATLEILDAHPYISKFQAKTIIAYRTEHGNFKTIEDLKKVKTLDETFFRKTQTYFSF